MVDDTMTANVALVKQLDQNLTSGIDDGVITAYLMQGQQIALADRFPKTVTIDDEELPIRDMATRYMALHLIATSNSSAGNGVTVEKVDVLEKHYADTSSLDWLNRSPWGQAYLRLFQEYGDWGLSRYSVVQH